MNEVHVFNPSDGSWYQPIVMGDKPLARSGLVVVLNSSSSSTSSSSNSNSSSRGNGADSIGRG